MRHFRRWHRLLVLLTFLMSLSDIQTQAGGIKLKAGSVFLGEAHVQDYLAGNDLTETYESAPDATRLDIQPEAKSRLWRVDVGKQDIHWHPDLKLYVRRTNRDDSIRGGETYQQVSDTGALFVEGQKSKKGEKKIKVEVQTSVSGVSVSIPPGIYSTTIIYTLTSE